MPTWLVHGFRWPRAQIRIHVILQNLDDAAPEWLMAPATTACMTKNFQEQFPEQVAHIPGLRFIEQYDPEDLTTKDQPYAYVCDVVHEVSLSADIEDVQGSKMTDGQETAITELRDKVAAGEKLGWFVVYNGDVERWAPPIEDEDDDTTPDASQFSPTSQRSSFGMSESSRKQEAERPSTSRSFKNWIGGRLRRSKSAKDLKNNMGTKEVIPPLPPMPPTAAIHSPKAGNGKHLPINNAI